MAATSSGRSLLIVALLTLVTTTGCDGSHEADGVPSQNGQGAKTGSAQSSSPPPSSGSVADGTVTTRPSPSAADGRDIGACADGDCQILVPEPVTVHFRGPSGAATLRVTEVGPNEVAYTVESGQGQSKGSARGPGRGCLTVLRGNGSGNSCGGLGDGTRPAPRPDAVVIQVAAGADGTVVLDIVSN
ncbi:hypothetical protein ACFWR9_27445 [Streptomyces sp. NPDC058534]|uniref:hypothetical protein n=1 Tax=Streptomyces sp. NPDC058534 TaxID=3346541 RepID=UPI00365924A4